MTIQFFVSRVFLAAALICVCGFPEHGLAGPVQDAGTYVAAIAKVNDGHVRQPGKTKEADLAKLVPATAKSALQRVLEAKPAPDLAPALLRSGEAALDLDLTEDFAKIRTRLETIAPDLAAQLGSAVSRPRLIVRGIGPFQDGNLATFADVCEAVLAGYDELFGFAEFSKVPGKKLRFRVHLEPAITKPPHFAPEFPYHSEIDFPVVDGTEFASPSKQGHFFFYGLCHELGHVIAMWGDLKNMEDEHAWAHYTGVLLVEHLTESAKTEPWMAKLRDVRWRSLKIERALPANQVPPSRANAAGVMAMFIALHDSVGPKTIGSALNQLDAQNKCHRVNHVRYYSFADFQRALMTIVPDKRAAIAAAFGAP